MVGATGTVRANQTANLGWQTSGKVAEVSVEPGDLVKKDALLAELEPTTLAQNIILAKADLVGAQKALDDLLQSGTPAAQAGLALVNAKQALEDAQNKVDSFKYKRATTEQVDNAKANLALAALNGEDLQKIVDRSTNRREA